MCIIMQLQMFPCGWSHSDEIKEGSKGQDSHFSVTLLLMTRKMQIYAGVLLS